jgi:hypothetical protein
MAFHPFKHFRKNQKVYLAGLTILTMIIFVFSFGAADPFYSVMRWIGMTRHGDKVLDLYGKTIYTDDLERLRRNRQLASEFLLYGIAYAPILDNALSEIGKRTMQRKGAADTFDNPVQRAFREWSNLRLSLQFMMMMPPEGREKQITDTLRNIQSELKHPEVQKDPELARQIDALAQAVAVQGWMLNPNRPRDESYFGGTPRTEDLLDFLVWKHEADKLGITLTPADICREVNRAWGGEEPLSPEGKLEANEHVRKFFTSSNRIHKTLTMRDLLTALTDEFRVALAQEAILGHSLGVRGYRQSVDEIHHSPSAATPDEFLKYFQQQRTTVAVNLLPVPVENFVAKVTAKPAEDSLRNLYERYKDNEPSPARRQPGFKEPRRIQVQYFSYKPAGPFARKLASKATELLPVFRATAPVAPFAAGGGLAWSANLGILDLSADLDPALRKLYEDYRREEGQHVLKYDGRDNDLTGRYGQGVDLNNRSAAEAQAPAALLGQLLGNAGSGATLLAAPISWQATNELYERATLTAFASTVLAGASSSPLVAATLPDRYVHSVQPFDAVRDKMLDRFQTDLAKNALEANIHTVQTELDKLLASHNKEKLDEYRKKAIADYGLENFHAMTTAQTRQEILDKPDPALKELQTAYEQSTENPFRMFGMGMDQRRPDFADALFHPVESRPIPGTPLRSWQFKSPSGDEVWVFWRSEDKPAHVRPYETVRTEVEKAWYFEQARKLARDEARRIDAELKKQRLNPSDAVKFLREQKQGEVFELTNVAHLVSRIFNLPGHKFTPNDYKPYQPPKDHIAYPPSDLVDQLLKLKEPGQSEVLADQPVKHYYVAVLMEKPQVPERREFFDIYTTPGPEDRLWNEMMESRQRTYFLKVIEQLRTDATKSVENGEYVLPDNIRGRGESSSSESE